MGSFVAENSDLVPEGDQYYFGIATVMGLRQQLRDNELPVGGRKYDLYCRLVDNGLRLYNDDRDDDIEDEDEDNGGSDGEENESSEEDDSEAEYIAGDGSEDEDSEEEDHQGGDDQEEDDDEDGGQGGDQPRRSGKKRDRDDDDQGPLAPTRRRIGIALPVELQAIIIENLNAPGVWNLIDSAPEEYLSGDINALVLEARYQYRLDYPPPPPSEAENRYKKIKKPVENPWPRPGRERPLSLLEWVARRASLDARFRTANRTRIMRVLDAYLEVYGMADPPNFNTLTRTPNPREDMLYYFRDRTTLLTELNQTPLMHAAQRQNLLAVQLLILRGANVNQAINGVTALELAAAVGFPMPPGLITEGLQTAFALLGAGADVTVLGLGSRTQASVSLQVFTQNRIPAPGGERPDDFARVENTLGLSIRQAIADERTHINDRIFLTLYAIFYRNIDYPRYI